MGLAQVDRSRLVVVAALKRRADAGVGLYLPAILIGAVTTVSAAHAGLTRVSIALRKKQWIIGSSPVMTPEWERLRCLTEHYCFWLNRDS
jgi:hypothetical protein